MAIEWSSPQPSALGFLAPTAAHDLFICAYRLAWRLDESTRGMRRPSPFSSVGVVAHGVAEAVTKGLLASCASAEDARSRLEALWQTKVHEAQEELKAAWAPAGPPQPEDWPGYHLIHTRTIRRGLRRFGSARARSAAQGESIAEKWFQDDDTRLAGRPDRIEGPIGDRCVVDLKTGIAQGEATPPQRRQLLLYAHVVGVTTGDVPRRVAIEDPSGRRWESEVTSEEIAGAVAEVIARRENFELAVASGRLESLAVPDRDTCRHCPYRLKCGPYWAALATDWGHGSVAGTAVSVGTAPAGSIISINGESPADSPGRWIVSSAPAGVVREGNAVAIVDGELTGSDRHLRWKWVTTYLAQHHVDQANGSSR